MNNLENEQIRKDFNKLREKGINIFESVEKYEEFLDEWNSIGCQSFVQFTRKDTTNKIEIIKEENI